MDADNSMCEGARHKCKCRNSKNQGGKKYSHNDAKMLKQYSKVGIKSASNG